MIFKEPPNLITSHIVTVILLQCRLRSDDYGKHLMGVQDLIQKHTLLESDISVIGDRVNSINSNAQKFVEQKFDDPIKGLNLFK